MIKVELTNELGSLIKRIRIENDIKSSELAAKLNKSVAYITKLENADFKQIEFDTLIEILKFIGNFESKSDDEFNDFINKILEKCRLEFDDEELEKQKWIVKFDKEIRLIPIPNTLINFIKDKMSELNIIGEYIINEINKNEELNDYDLKAIDLNKVKANSIFIKYTKDSILEFVKFDLKTTLIDNIISKKIKTINYITILSIIKTIFKLDNFDTNTAYEKAVDILKQNKIYTLKERNELLRQKRNSIEIDHLLSDYDKDNIKYVNKIISHFKMLSDWQIDYTNPKLNNLSKSLDADAPFVLAIVGQDFFKLDKLKVEDKKRFLEKLSDLVETFSKIEYEEKESFIEY